MNKKTQAPSVHFQTVAARRAPPANMAACPVHRLKNKLRAAGLRPTRQRLALGWLLLGKGERHVTAESLHEEASALKAQVSLATVYNTLHQFKEAGLLREIAIEGSKSWFDTNTQNHHHFLLPGSGKLIDVVGADVVLDNLPALPAGMEIDRVDVVIRLRPSEKPDAKHGAGIKAANP